MSMNVVGSDELKDMEFGAISLREPYGSLLGQIERKTGIYVWGAEGSGKSTLALGMARALVPHAMAAGGTVLYASREEGPDRKVRDRAQRIGATHPALLISDFESIDALKETIEEYGVEFLVIDSVSALNLRSKKAQNLVQWIQKEKRIGLIAVSHANAKGQPKGETYLPHMLDVVIKCYPVDGGERKIHVAETTKNRYAELTMMEIPMTADQIGRDISEEQAARENPDCSKTPQTDQCKAIFAKLSQSGQYDASIPTSTNGEDKGKAAQEAAEKATSSADTAETAETADTVDTADTDEEEAPAGTDDEPTEPAPSPSSNGSADSQQDPRDALADIKAMLQDAIQN